MKDDKKYHRGGRVPTPRGQVPHPRIGSRGTRTSDERLRRQQELAARKELAKLKAKAKSTGAKQLTMQPTPPALAKLLRDQALERARQQRARQQIMEPSRVPSRIDMAKRSMMPRQYIEQMLRARNRNRPSPIQQPRPVRGATPIQATPQPMSMPPQVMAGPAPRRPTQRRRSGSQIREDMNRRMRRTRRR
jgi:hypothetical protein